jgi:hypothetical protein
MDIADVFWIAMSETLKNSVRLNLQKYEDDEKYRIKKIYEGIELKGFCVCHDEDDFTVLDECHYIGSDKYAALKMWKFMTAGKKNLRIICQKANTKMAEFYKNIGFKIIGESDLDFTFTRVK